MDAQYEDALAARRQQLLEQSQLLARDAADGQVSDAQLSSMDNSNELMQRAAGADVDLDPQVCRHAFTPATCRK